MARKRKTTAATNNAADFDSVAEFTAWANDGQLANEDNRDRYAEVITKSGSDYWYGLPGDNNAADIAKLINAGWTDGANKTARNAGNVAAPRVDTVRRRRVRGDRGDTIDMDRVYSGALDTAWTRTARATSQQPPRVRIATNMSTPGSADAETLFWRGAAALALASRLMAAGYAVQMITAIAGEHKQAHDSAPASNFCITVTTKDWRAPLDLPTLAASTALAGFFRAFGFLGLIKLAPAKLSYGLGYPRNLTDANLPPVQGCITVTINDGQCETQGDASAWIKQQIEQIETGTLRAAA